MINCYSLESFTFFIKIDDQIDSCEGNEWSTGNVLRIEKDQTLNFVLF